MNLVEQSFKNCVDFHRAELLLIQRTNSAGHLSINKRRSLRKHGVLMENRKGRGVIWNLTAKTIKVLEELSKMTPKTAQVGVNETAPKGLLVPGPLKDLTNIEEEKS